MHTGAQLNVDQFAVEVDGQKSTVGDLFPRWHKHQRFGIVIQGPFGGVGASLLIQAAVASHHRFASETWDEAIGPVPGPAWPSVYPEAYAIHVGRRWGDMGFYDIWPEHKETLVEANPRSVLSAINDNGITILAVPEGDEREPELFWPEHRTFLWRTESVFSYSPSGRVQDADVTIRGLDPATEDNTTWTLEPRQFLQYPPIEDPATANGTFLVEGDDEADDRRFRSTVGSRLWEVSRAERAAALATRQEIVVDGLATETYRRRDARYALRRLVP